MIPIGLNNAVSHLIICIKPPIQYTNGGAGKLIKVDCQEKDLATNLNKKHNKKAESYLCIDVIRKMLKKFLIEKKMSKESLAKALGITEKELHQLLFYKTVTDLVKKINFPLIKLFCETRFENQE